MKRTITITSIVLVVLAFVIIIFPKITSKELYTYEEAIEKFAEGKFVTVDNKKVHYIEKGNGKPIILIHGFLYNTVMWKQNIDALAKEFKVYAIDLWGWGYSQRLNKTDYSFQLYGKQVTGFMDALSIKKASLAGQSMGGGVSVYVAAHYPERVDRLILVAPAVIPYPMPTNGKIYELPFVGEFLNAIPGNALMGSNIKTVWFYDHKIVTEDYVKEVIQPFGIKGSYSGMMYILRNVVKPPFLEKEATLVAKMNTPILIIHGREDSAIPLDRSEQLNNLWPESKLVIFEKAGHSPHEEYPEKFNKLSTAFLSD